MSSISQKAEEQIRNEQQTISYNTHEYTVEVLVKKFEDGDLFIPGYQRDYIWSEKRKQKFIESVLLGLPIPFIFAADCDDGRLEIIDGVQRINTLFSFVKNQIKLGHLEKLNLLTGETFSQLPLSQQRKFLNRSLRMIVLSDSTDKQVRFDIFERINTGTDSLKSSELRKGAQQGEFYSFISECAQLPLFNKLCPVGEAKKKRAEREELILRFFAYSEKYLEFDHSVSSFLDAYLKEKNKDGFDKKLLRARFENMLKFVDLYFPNGFTKTANASTTPRVRFEAISIGINLALQERPDLKINDINWLSSTEFKEHTTSDASNSKVKLKARIEFVKNSLLGKK